MLFNHHSRFAKFATSWKVDDYQSKLLIGEHPPRDFLRKPQDFARNLRDTAEELCQDIIDLTPVLVECQVKCAPPK